MTEYCHFHMAVTKIPGQTTYRWKYLSSVHHVEIARRCVWQQAHVERSFTSW